MSTYPLRAPAELAPAAARFRSERPADRAMRRLLGITATDRRSGRQAHRAFRIAVVASGIRCLITYLMIPVLVPVLSLSGWVSAPITLVLCTVAVVNGVLAVRRFWHADHRLRWMYTGFMGVVFLILAIGVFVELQRWMVMA